MRLLSRLLPLLCLLPLAACAPRLSAEQSTTATARVADIPRQATAMARQYRLTQLAGEAHATATVQAMLETVTRARQWPVLFSDPFDSNLRSWAEGQESGQYADATWTLDGQFRWEVVAHEGFVWWNYPEMEAISDFYLAVDARQDSGPVDGYLGVTLRHSGENDYLSYSITQEGLFGLDRHTADGWETLIPTTPFAAIRPYESNHLEVIAQGTRLWLFANGQLAATYEDAGLTEGKCGLIVGMNNADEQGTFTFDNFEIRLPNLPLPPPATTAP